MAAEDTGRNLSDLVDSPEERLDAEYKAQFDLTDPAQRAKLAQHIAALANHGGGYLVAGFSDAMVPIDPPPSPISRDDVASVVRKYLEPTFECALRTVRSAAGRDHQVIVVPSHEAAPICAKANGPDIGKKIVGVTQGTYYIRKAGPESAPILTANEWQKVIRRCTSYDRVAILAAIEQAIAGSAQVRDDARERTEELAAWHDLMAADFIASVAKHGAPQHLVDAYFQFSYLIDPPTGGPSLDELFDALRTAEREVDSYARSGWPLFIFYDGPGGASYRTSPHISGGALEFVELNTVRDGSRVGASDMWRVTATGLASSIRGFVEDSANGQRAGFRPSLSLSPNWLVRNVAELVAHASSMMRSYPHSTRIFFRCEWTGLQDRIAEDPFRRWHFTGRPAKENNRLSIHSYSIGEIAADPLNIIQDLAAPVLRLLGVSGVITREWLESEASSWPQR